MIALKKIKICIKGISTPGTLDQTSEGGMVFRLTERHPEDPDQRVKVDAIKNALLDKNHGGNGGFAISWSQVKRDEGDFDIFLGVPPKGAGVLSFLEEKLDLDVSFSGEEMVFEDIWEIEEENKKFSNERNHLEEKLKELKARLEKWEPSRETFRPRSPNDGVIAREACG
jgi:hypothetical protein